MGMGDDGVKMEEEEHMSDDTGPPLKRLQTSHSIDIFSRQTTATGPTPTSSSPFLRAVVDRRTRQSICKVSPIPHSHIVDIVATAVKYVPSAFNCQSSRTITLFNHHHDKFWDETLLTLQQIVPPEKFASTQERILGFKAGVGTVLFFEDYDVVNCLIEQFPFYTDKFMDWSHHSSGMLQFIVWTSLSQEGLGASLQHYSVVEDKVKDIWQLPRGWRLIAQMPFGTPTIPDNERTFLPVEERALVFE